MFNNLLCYFENNGQQQDDDAMQSYGNTIQCKMKIPKAEMAQNVQIL